MRLIDADTLLAEYDKIHVGEPGRARKLIAEQPTIEIVLCKDCIHNISERTIADGRYLCGLYGSFMYYCSDAERRTDG